MDELPRDERLLGDYLNGLELVALRPECILNVLRYEFVEKLAAICLESQCELVDVSLVLEPVLLDLLVDRGDVVDSKQNRVDARS